MAQTLTRPDFIESAALARAALWKAALREGPGETPKPAGRALLADLRKLWLAREEEQMQAMREPPFPLPVDWAAWPLAALWAWWPDAVRWASSWTPPCRGSPSVPADLRFRRVAAPANPRQP